MDISMDIHIRGNPGIDG